MFKYNKLTIEGDNNIVLQDVDGQTITDSFENFLKKFTEEKDQRIASLERMVNMSESLSRLEVEKAGRELHDVRIEKEVLEKTVRKLVEDFNGKNLTETSGLYKQAFSLFTSGDLKTAIEVLNQRNIDDDLAEIEREERTAISKLEKSRSARRKLSEELAFKAQLLGVDSLIDQARQTFERAISIDRNIHTVGGYAFFLHFLQDYQNASELLVELLDTDLNNTEKVKVLNELGLIETAKNDFTGAAAHLSQALKLAGDNNDIHNLGMTNMNLGSVYTKLHNFESGLSSYLQAEKYLQDVLTHSVSDSNINSLALAKANSGWAYLELKQFEIAGTKYAEALNLFGDGRKEKKTGRDYALVLKGAALFYDTVGQFDKSIGLLIECAAIFRQLVSKNPSSYSAELANVLNNLGTSYTNTNDHREAIRYFREGIKMLVKYELVYPEVYKDEIAGIYGNLGTAHERLEEFPDAEKNYLQAIHRYRDLVSDSPAAYNASLARVLSNCAVLYDRMEKPLKAIELNEEALEIYHDLSKVSPYLWLPDMGLILHNIGVVYDHLKEYETGAEYHSFAIDKYSEAGEHLPESRKVHAADARLGHSISLLNLRKVQDGAIELSAAIDQYRHLYKSMPATVYFGYCYSMVTMARVISSSNPVKTDEARNICNLSKDILLKYKHLGNPGLPSLLAHVEQMLADVSRTEAASDSKKK